jgi:hypothetical protein
LDDDGDDADYAGDGAGREKKLGWMIALGRCWPLKNAPNSLAECFRAQRQKEPAQSPAQEELMCVSRYISQGSEIPREDIET